MLTESPNPATLILRILHNRFTREPPLIRLLQASRRLSFFFFSLKIEKENRWRALPEYVCGRVGAKWRYLWPVPLISMALPDLRDHLNFRLIYYSVHLRSPSEVSGKSNLLRCRSARFLVLPLFASTVSLPRWSFLQFVISECFSPY